MSFGLLSGAFRPQAEISVLRAVARQREMLVQYQAKHIKIDVDAETFTFRCPNKRTNTFVRLQE
jgi:hypothetical protein